jgi:hypothetical protein
LNGVGADSKNLLCNYLLLVYCPKGHDILNETTETCQPCKRGYYKDNMDVFSACMQCPSGNTTEGMKATSIDDCSISKFRITFSTIGKLFRFFFKLPLIVLNNGKITMSDVAQLLIHIPSMVFFVFLCF